MSVFEEQSEKFDVKTLIILIILVASFIILNYGHNDYNDDISCTNDIHGRVCE